MIYFGGTKVGVNALKGVDVEKFNEIGRDLYDLKEKSDPQILVRIYEYTQPQSDENGEFPNADANLIFDGNMRYSDVINMADFENWTNSSSEISIQNAGNSWATSEEEPNYENGDLKYKTIKVYEAEEVACHIYQKLCGKH